MPTVYKSADPSAPTLSGSVGDLTKVLKACLVDGYGSKSAAGWTNPYNGTNQRVFLQGGSGILKYFQFDDNGPGLAGAQEARMWGFETMSAYNTGTFQFPASANPVAIRKSVAASAALRDWIVVADGKTCHMFILTGDVASQYMAFSFGDIYSFSPGDSWKGYLIGRSVENSATGNNEAWSRWSSNALAAIGGCILQRSYTGFNAIQSMCNAGGSGTLAEWSTSSTVVGLSGSITFPNGPDGNLLLTPYRIAQSFAAPNIILRGRYRGIYFGLHPGTSFNDQDTFSGVNEYAGKTFLIVKPVLSVATQTNYYIVETSTWDESS